MMTTFAVPMAVMFDVASPASDLSWIAPLAFAAAIWVVVLVAKGVARDRQSRIEAPAPADFRQAA